MPRPRWHLEIRIIKPLPSEFEGFDTSRFEVGRVYDVNSPLCDLLVTGGYAVENVKPTPDAAATDTRPAAPPHEAHDQPPPKRRR